MPIFSTTTLSKDKSLSHIGFKPSKAYSRGEWSDTENSTQKIYLLCFIW
jgi:hypothetical protein